VKPIGRGVAANSFFQGKEGGGSGGKTRIQNLWPTSISEGCMQLEKCVVRLGRKNWGENRWGPLGVVFKSQEANNEIEEKRRKRLGKKKEAMAGVLDYMLKRGHQGGGEIGVPDRKRQIFPLCRATGQIGGERSSPSTYVEGKETRS